MASVADSSRVARSYSLVHSRIARTLEQASIKVTRKVEDRGTPSGRRYTGCVAFADNGSI